MAQCFSLLKAKVPAAGPDTVYVETPATMLIKRHDGRGDLFLGAWGAGPGQYRAIYEDECGRETAISAAIGGTTSEDGYDTGFYWSEQGVPKDVRPITFVPEPAAVPMLGVGIIVLGILRQWRRK